MFTSMGYHTFVKSKGLTQEEAGLLFKEFKEYRDKSNEICIMGPNKYKKDLFGRHYEIVYPKQYKGIQWKIRFSNRGFYFDDEFKPCSIQAIINPKVLIGEKSYIVAADASYLKEVEKIFEQEAEKISPILKGFYKYRLNRIDYCINFDVSELKFDYPPELYPYLGSLSNVKRAGTAVMQYNERQMNAFTSIKTELPKLIMELIKCADIPDHFDKKYDEEYQFYLKSKSVVVNCYWKYDDLNRNFSGCKDLEKSYNIIRFEVQFKYPKVYSMSNGIKNERERRKSLLMKAMEKEGIGNFSEIQRGMDNKEQKCLFETYMDIARSDEVVIMETMLSDKQCDEIIEDYFYKVIKKGDYYTLDAARKVIESRVSKWEKVIRLETALQLVCEYGSIAEVKKALQGEKLEEFRRSLRDLAGIRINPVTIPKAWGIEYIPNLLDNYYFLRAEEQRKIQEKEQDEQMLRDYIKDCKKRGVSWYKELKGKK